jgi:hypothetical protein
MSRKAYYKGGGKATGKSRHALRFDVDESTEDH